jgi:transcriptional regulator with XRE-family HTH domain
VTTDVKDIKGLRALSGLSQYCVANRTGVDRCRISSFENGHLVPRPEERSRIEKVLLAEIARRAAEFRLVVAGTALD